MARFPPSSVIARPASEKTDPLLFVLAPLAADLSLKREVENDTFCGRFSTAAAPA